jgi:hypothetical protein
VGPWRLWLAESISHIESRRRRKLGKVPTPPRPSFAVAPSGRDHDVALSLQFSIRTRFPRRSDGMRAGAGAGSGSPFERRAAAALRGARISAPSPVRAESLRPKSACGGRRPNSSPRARGHSRGAARSARNILDPLRSSKSARQTGERRGSGPRPRRERRQRLWVLAKGIRCLKWSVHFA